MSGGSESRLTVLMPVRDGERFLQEAIDSILGQSWREFEFLIVDDGSTDRTPAILAENAARDGRIRPFRVDAGAGIAGALNRGLELARGGLVARMDSDDVALPHRLKLQVDFMQRHPEIGVCGGALSVYERPGEQWIPPRTHDGILVRMLFECPLFHPTVIFRKEIVCRAGGYSSNFPAAEDYELWQRLAVSHGVRFANLPQNLIQYRTHPERDRSAYIGRQRQTASSVRSMLLAAIDLSPNGVERACHDALAREIDGTNLPAIADCLAWIERIEAANRVGKMFGEDGLDEELRQRWEDICVQAACRRRSDALMIFRIDRGLGPLSMARALARMVWHWWRHDCRPQ